MRENERERERKTYEVARDGVRVKDRRKRGIYLVKEKSDLSESIFHLRCNPPFFLISVSLCFLSLLCSYLSSLSLSPPSISLSLSLFISLSLPLSLSVGFCMLFFFLDFCMTNYSSVPNPHSLIYEIKMVASNST